MSPTVFNVCMDDVAKKWKIRIGRALVQFSEEVKIKDRLTSCIWMSWYHMVQACTRKDLKVNVMWVRIKRLYWKSRNYHCVKLVLKGRGL